MKFTFEHLTETIENYEIITIYRHEHPDCDAMGSQYALKTWLKENYPDKKIYTLGNETTQQAPFPASDQVSDDEIKKSLAIVLDTANEERVDDQRFHEASYIIKIDHHPDREPFGDLSFVYDKAAATCEILTTYFRSCPDRKLSLQGASYLYEGLLTDTLCFRTSNTTSHTLDTASYLADFGMDIPALNRLLFDMSYEDFLFSAHLRSHVRWEKGRPAYYIADCETMKHYDLTPPETRNFIDELGHVKDFEIWAVFTQHEDGSALYDGSLRSKSIRINDLAEKYHGGGHPNASGVKNLTEEDIHSLLDELSERIKS